MKKLLASCLVLAGLVPAGADSLPKKLQKVSGFVRSCCPVALTDCPQSEP